MNRKSAIQQPDVPGIDLGFRPQSYFWPRGLEPHLLTSIKGAERRAMLAQLIDEGFVGQIPDFLARSLTGEERELLGRFHPSFMGGEYLPDLRSFEVGVARVEIDSVTNDVTSVYARRGKNRIYYRVVDEYDGDFLSGVNTRTSIRPLTLGQLEAFLDGAWSVYNVLAMNFGYRDYDRDAMLRFVNAHSVFYPRLDELYKHRIDTWGAMRRGEQAKTVEIGETTP